MKIINKFSQNKLFLALTVVMFLVLVVRLWSFGSLLTFKMDQARDIKLIEKVYFDGPEELPLLGPRAAKTYLRLGPIFYYFEYLAMLIFGDKPWAVAMPDLFFSLLGIPLFYYFLCQIFDKKISFLTTTVFAFSFFLNQYGRFAWNPNSIPFWSLLFFLSLYKLVVGYWQSVNKGAVAGKNEQSKWVFGLTIGYLVASQLHFTAMLAYPLIAFLVIVFTVGGRRVLESKSKGFGFLLTKEFWRDLFLRVPVTYWLASLLLLLIGYLPVIFSEMYTGGDNWRQFKYALSSQGKAEFPFLLKLIQSLKLHSQYFWFTLTSWAGGANSKGVVAGFILFVLSATIWFLRKSWGDFKSGVLKYCGREKNVDGSRMLFFVLIMIWWGVMFCLYTKLAFNVLKPRYWLLEAPIFFVMLAVALEKLFKSGGKSGRLLGYGVFFGLLLANLWATGNWYWELEKQKNSPLPLWSLKLKDENEIPWRQLQKTADYIENLARQTDKDVCFYTTGEYRPVYDYIFKRRGLDKKIRRMSFSQDTNENCLFVAIDHHRHRETPRIPRNHKNEFEKVAGGKKEIGFVTVWMVHRKLVRSKVGSNNEQRTVSREQRAENSEQGAVSREQRTVSKEQEGMRGGRKKIKKPRRVERVSWRDFFEFLRKKSGWHH